MSMTAEETLFDLESRIMNVWKTRQTQPDDEKESDAKPRYVKITDASGKEAYTSGAGGEFDEDCVRFIALEDRIDVGSTTLSAPTALLFVDPDSRLQLWSKVQTKTVIKFEFVCVTADESIVTEEGGFENARLKITPFFLGNKAVVIPFTFSKKTGKKTVVDEEGKSAGQTDVHDIDLTGGSK